MNGYETEQLRKARIGALVREREQFELALKIARERLANGDLAPAERGNLEEKTNAYEADINTIDEQLALFRGDAKSPARRAEKRPGPAAAREKRSE